MYLLLQHGHLVREQSHNVLLAKRLGQEETESGTYCGEDTGKKKTIPCPKQGPSQDVLEGIKSFNVKSISKDMKMHVVHKPSAVSIIWEHRLCVCVCVCVCGGSQINPM